MSVVAGSGRQHSTSTAIRHIHTVHLLVPMFPGCLGVDTDIRWLGWEASRGGVLLSAPVVQEACAGYIQSTFIFKLY
jgi:hypothetical protein